MSGRTDRRMQSAWPLFGAVALITALAGAGFFFWFTSGGVKPIENSVVRNAGQPAQTIHMDEQRMVTVYYPQEGLLVAGSARIRMNADTRFQARETAAMLVSDQRLALNALRLREFFLDDAGTAYVDFSFGQADGFRASVREELLVLYSVVNTLTQNFEEIKQVRILLDGREAQTLAGHIDISRPFSRRMDLVKQ